jgi:hypothetical protein
MYFAVHWNKQISDVQGNIYFCARGKVKKFSTMGTFYSQKSKLNNSKMHKNCMF